VYVVPREGETVTLADVSSFMKEKGMAIYKTPERVELIEAIPRNPVGKIMKNVLREDIRKKLAQ
jgi:non-ribosomal peptide synthetase component E (peptide arylation enzyme)